jgi:hypothetical protein
MIAGCEDVGAVGLQLQDRVPVEVLDHVHPIHDPGAEALVGRAGEVAGL